MKTALTYMAATVFLLAAAGCSENPGGGELSGDGTVELSMDIAATRSGSGTRCLTRRRYTHSG